jgi:hypothetical protein
MLPCWAEEPQMAANTIHRSQLVGYVHHMTKRENRIPTMGDHNGHPRSIPLAFFLNDIQHMFYILLIHRWLRRVHMDLLQVDDLDAVGVNQVGPGIAFY